LDKLFCVPFSGYLERAFLPHKISLEMAHNKVFCPQKKLSPAFSKSEILVFSTKRFHFRIQRKEILTINEACVSFPT
jgi:hypothetical protein